MLGDQLGQLIYWIWFFQEEGTSVRQKLDDGDPINPWVKAMLTDFRDAREGTYLHDAFTAPADAINIVNDILELPDELVKWQWRTRRIVEISRAISALLSVSNPKAATMILESVARAELVSIDTLHSLDAAVAACQRLDILAAAHFTFRDPGHLRRLLSSIDAGVIGVWRVMYLDSSQIWDRLHVAIRSLPIELTQSYDVVIKRLTCSMKDRPPLSNEPLPNPIHPRPN